MAQVLSLPLQEHHRLPVAQSHPVRAKHLTGEVALRVHTDVVGHLQATVEDAGALETFVVSAMMILHTHIHTHTHTHTQSYCCDTCFLGMGMYTCSYVGRVCKSFVFL